MACIYQYRVIQSSFTALEILHALPGHTARLLGQVVLMKYRLCFPLSTILALNLSFAPGPRPFAPPIISCPCHQLWWGRLQEEQVQGGEYQGSVWDMTCPRCP